ncbi:hypothetical protein [Kutzneria buriramensis]|uniref:O-antigen/teichoic acid export membrane protein n=1 Tax=Kutzneria buriramensis TaxID=1045776 RepID=A0A3E0HUE5_9PSEU|nr:hypothetical protein [Kutzneria buriramensis]REH50031.1 O-antigen/teichoic acid export membrane protein [Kutzneria buriramensis]
MNLKTLLRGPMPLIGGGLALVVLAGLVFTAVTTRAIKPFDQIGLSALINGLYYLVNTVALGVFSGVEQEGSRAVSQERAAGRAVTPIVHAMARQSMRLFALTTVVMLIVSPFLVGPVLGGHWELLAELIIALFATACASTVRGVLAGSQRFGGYAATQATEGLVRIIPLLLLLFLGVHQPWAYGLVFVLAQVFAALVGVLILRTGTSQSWGQLMSTPPARDVAGAGKVWFGVSIGLVLLVLASLTNQAVVNLPPVIGGAKLQATMPLLATAVGAAIGLTRLPMFAFVPLQTMLLPQLTAAVGRGDKAGVRRQTLRTSVACVALGLLGVTFLGTLGPWLLSIYVPGVSNLSGATLAGLGVGTLFLMTANVTQPALIALGRHRTVLVAYLVGTAAMALAFVVPVDPVLGVVLSTSAGPIALVLVMAVALAKATRPTADQQHVMA